MLKTSSYSCISPNYSVFLQSEYMYFIIAQNLSYLGLPSGTKWACCNVGASKPEDYGGYYAWGEISEKETYGGLTYIHLEGSSSPWNELGSDIAGTQYDAASANWGNSWVMPSFKQYYELMKQCTSEWISDNGVRGRKFTGPNGTSIFLPAAGDRNNWGASDFGPRGYYWSSTLNESGNACAWFFYFDSNYSFADYGDFYIYNGRSVRAVHKN